MSQWRGYSRDVPGYCLGFDANQLVEAGSRARCFLAPCIYDPNRQQELIDALWAGAFNDVMPGSRRSTLNLAMDFISRLIVRAFIIREEREWRIVSQEIPDDHPRLGVREGRFVLIPYFEFPLTTAEEKLDREIVVGPNREMDLAIASLITLLTTKRWSAFGERQRPRRR